MQNKYELERRLEWGYLTLTGAKAAWGARAIAERDGAYSFLGDRMSWSYDDPDDQSTLLRVLNGNCQDGALKAAATVYRGLWEANKVANTEGEEHILYDDGNVIIIANTNGSCGYVYLSASLVG